MNKYLVRFVIPFYLILISFSLTSQIQYLDYQDGVIIFQLKTNEFFEVKSKERIIDYQKVSFLSPLSSKYDIEKIIQLYPNHKSEKLSRTFQINFNEIQKVDDFIIELNNINVIEYAEKKELHKTRKYIGIFLFIF